MRDLRHYLEACEGDADLIAAEYLSLESRLEDEQPAAGTIGPYRLEEEIGRGGQGVVYRAVDGRMDRTVALKVLNGLGGNAGAALERFKREARAASKTDHT